MTIRYTLEKISINGIKDTRSQDFDKTEILIGRGGGCDVLLQSSYVSLIHAKFGITDGKPFIEDQGTVSSILVNNSVEKYATLQEGDLVKLADISLEVIKEDGHWGLKEVRQEVDKPDNEEVVAGQLKQLNVANSLPSFKTLSILFFLVIAGLFLVWPYFSKDQSSWEAGPISNHHSMIASDCKSCHSVPFVQVKDEQCLSCHKMTNHSEIIKNHPKIEGRCASCHMEHNGTQALVIDEAKLCINCHGDLKSKFADAKSPGMQDFKTHPQFAVEVQPLLPGEKSTKVSLDNAAALRDNSNIKLNHEVHLQPIKSKNETVQLQCRDCHNASEDLKSIQPINFEKHCNSCHGLEFDDRLKGIEVPHGDPNVVYNFLYAEYAKLLLGSDDSPKAEASFVQRFKPGGSLPSVSAQPSIKDDFKQAFVEKESRKSERQLFTRTACYLCHRILEEDAAKALPEKSHFEVIKPQIHTDWMPSANFDHGAHEEIKCEDCHSGVSQSTKTNQVLLPKVEKCQTCHADQEKHGLVKSDCVMCHSYHDQQLVSEEKKRNINDILKTVTR